MTTDYAEKIYDKELQENIKVLMEEKKVDSATIARGIGKSPTTLSLYMQSKYNGNVESLENDLKKYLEFFTKKQTVENKALGFVETSIVKKVFNAANMCQMRGKMGVCYGTPGIGKTTAVLEYQKLGTGVIVVDPIEKTSTRAVLQEIADQLKLNYYQNITLDEFTSNVIKKLEKNKYLLIIDEAENLKVDIFKILRKIHDKTKNSCGILFVGTESLFELLKKVKNGFPYITSRIGYLERLNTLKPDDIEKLVIQYYPTVEKKLITTIAKTCNHNARAIQNLLDLCFEITSKNNIELDVDVIDSAKENLLI